ncbi:hypothetical protein VH570_19710 [Sphingobium sp. HT1-2]|uniref:hypothetical protein n=1 Tax=Sphingobium sp. HT1-2 TaxID=3111640 RepID=UPI003C04AFF3
MSEEDAIKAAIPGASAGGVLAGSRLVKHALAQSMRRAILHLAHRDEAGSPADRVVARAKQFEVWLGQFNRAGQDDAFACLKLALDPSIFDAVAPGPPRTETVLERATAYCEFIGLTTGGCDGSI